jgi:phage FluMu gp28-like protein
VRKSGNRESAKAETYFLPYQKAWIQDEGRLKICQKGRQIGLSYADSYDSVRKAAQAGGRDVWVMSRDEVQAKQYILYCKRWANVLQYAANDFGQDVLTEDGKAVKAQVMSFASGANIYALSSNPDAIVGKTGHVKLDEFALHKDQRQLFAVAKPVIQWGGTLSIISTHRGVATVFNQLIGDIQERGNKMGWSLHTIPIQRAVADGIVEKIDAATGGMWSRKAESENRESGKAESEKRESGKAKSEKRESGKAESGKAESEKRESGKAESEKRESGKAESEKRESGKQIGLREFWMAQQRAECIDEEQWLQEYCCVPADESTAFISYDMITGVEDRQLRLSSADELIGQIGRIGPIEGRTFYLGMDVARKKDLCVIDVGERVGDVMWDRARVELQNKTFAEIKFELYRLLRLGAVRRCCIDATGMGMQLAEEAKAEFGWKVEPVTFTAPVKEELAFGLKMAFEDKKLRIPADDKLRADLRGIKKEVTMAGNIRFVGDSDDSHCDRFWAKALRQHAAKANVSFTSTLI